MADASLDDFFAKKDKSKKKSKASKVTPGDILAKTDEPAKKKKVKKDKDKTQTSSDTASTTDVGGLIVKLEEEEEWKEVEEEKEKDYSGLRIANLQVTDREEDDEDGEEDEREDENGEGGDRKEKEEQGPWKTAGVQPPVTPKPPPPPAEPAKVEETPKEEAKPTGKYIPPSQRAAAAAGGTATPTGPTIPAHIRNRKKVAPNLRSEEDFPTLSGGPAPAHDSDPRSFERVQHGGRQTDDPTKSSQQLSLGNKFSALQD